MDIFRIAAEARCIGAEPSDGAAQLRDHVRHARRHFRRIEGREARRRQMRAGIHDRVGEIDEGIVGLRPPAPAMNEQQNRRPSSWSSASPARFRASRARPRHNGARNARTSPGPRRSALCSCHAAPRNSAPTRSARTRRRALSACSRDRLSARPPLTSPPSAPRFMRGAQTVWSIVGPEFAPALATPTIAGRSSRSCMR